MMNYKTQKKCRKCKKLSSDLEEGVCYKCRTPQLIRNNPKGYNKHIKNPEPKIPEVLKPVAKEDVQEAYREFWKAKRVALSKAHRFHSLHKKFLALDKIEEEVDEEMKLLFDDSE